MTASVIAQFVRQPLICSLVHAFSKAVEKRDGTAPQLRRDIMRELEHAQDEWRRDEARELEEHLDAIDKPEGPRGFGQSSFRRLGARG